MSYSDDLLDQTPAPQREGFTNYEHWLVETASLPIKFEHWRVTQTGPGGTTNWFSSYREAAQFRLQLGAADRWRVVMVGASCEEFESAWPEDWRRAHTHGASSDGERQRATEPDTARSDARRSQRLGRLI